MKVDNGRDPLDSRFAAFASLLTTEKLTAGVTHGPLRFLHGFGNVLMINSTCKDGYYHSGQLILFACTNAPCLKDLYLSTYSLRQKWLEDSRIWFEMKKTNQKYHCHISAMP